jgi:hypothetical protein
MPVVLAAYSVSDKLAAAIRLRRVITAITTPLRRVVGEGERCFPNAIPSPLAPEFVTPLIGSHTSIRFALGKFHFEAAA